MTELRIHMAKLHIEEIENILSGSIAGNAGDSRCGGSELEGGGEPRRDNVGNAIRPLGTSSSETQTTKSTLTASSLQILAPGPFQLETWARKFEQHESTAYLMERPLLSDCDFSPGNRKLYPIQDRDGEKRQNSNRAGELNIEDGGEDTLSFGPRLPLSSYPQSLDENDLGEDHLGENDEALTIQSQQNHSLGESMIQQEENAEYTIRAPHSQQDNTLNIRAPHLRQGNTINLQAGNITPRFWHQHQRY